MRTQKIEEEKSRYAKLYESSNEMVKKANEEIEIAQKSKDKEALLAQATIKKLKMKNRNLEEQLKGKT